ncbi:16S rRNA (cytidine(1402)-2'-O)-methyltransferase [Abyssisolibacter fermentans]|uniref:16S rRNA (cytidine(1402)-2'-O)-methyltransferase n=1 Tax=Abyssisolibacter fermentans TaxID=1766203 RepID=UPI0008319EAB|nr:16S rRNA (cytidine(1402)-2'-O)-methyltransferase [Abyssisolibacter fermentans]
MNEYGKLRICATPIGNLKDITYRVVETLKEVDLIAAEDTRHTLKILNHYDIRKPLISYHEHNKAKIGLKLIEKLKAGVNIALVSDAGMPGISDPGEDLIRLAIENNIQVDALPGASASILALVLSGFSTKKFVFEGFLPSAKKERKRGLEKLKTEYRTIILYEAPHRLLDLLQDISNVLGNKNIAIARELTKKYQEICRGTVLEIIEIFANKSIKGEFVVVVEGVSEDEIAAFDKQLWDDMDVKEHLRLYIQKGFTKKEAIKKVSKERKIPKNIIYKESIDL